MGGLDQALRLFGEWVAMEARSISFFMLLPRYPIHPTEGLQLTSNDLQPTSDGLQPTSDLCVYAGFPK